jgi:hypothetical protein
MFNGSVFCQDIFEDRKYDTPQALTWFFIMGIITLESVHGLRGVILPVFKDILTKEGAIKHIADFVKAMTGLTSFFLGLFTSMSLSRVSKLWDDGMARIFRGTEKLCIMLSQDLPERWVETYDPTQPPREVEREAVVSSFHRWSQASIILLFERYGSNTTPEDALRIAHQKRLLTDEELAALQQISDNHALAIWAWHFKTIQKAIEHKLVSIPIQPYHIVHNEAIYGVTNLQEQLRQPFPFSYISLISMFVKFMNTTITATGGVIAVRALLNHNELEACFDFATCFLLPLITNSVVILNLYLANPLRDHFTSWSPDDILDRLDKSVKAVQQASINTPTFLTTQWEKKTITSA